MSGDPHICACTLTGHQKGSTSKTLNQWRIKYSRFHFFIGTNQQELLSVSAMSLHQSILGVSLSSVVSDDEGLPAKGAGGEEIPDLDLD